MSDEKPRSKYAAKVAARRDAQAKADRAIAAIDHALRVTENKVAPNPQPKKEKVPPPPPRSKSADLGDMPTRFAALCFEAEAKLREAVAIAQTMQEKANRGRQSGEILSVIGIAAQLPDKAHYAGVRAQAIPNAATATRNQRTKEGQE